MPFEYMIQEKLLHFIWQNLLFRTSQLKGTEGEDVRIVHNGTLNRHAGPDFINARIYIDHTLWAGNVEIHVQSGDWNKHRHTGDPGYNNTILHVCWEVRETARRSDGSAIPCLCLSDYVDIKMLQRYTNMMADNHEIACRNQIGNARDLRISGWLDHLMAERMEVKTDGIRMKRKQTHSDWNQVFYTTLARSFGLTINAEAFDELAHRLPFKRVIRYRNQPVKLDALLFGTSGLLGIAPPDPYVQTLSNTFALLQKKYEIIPMGAAQWKFLRLMPAGFPSVRIAQFSALLQERPDVFPECMYLKTIKDFESYFSVQAGPYWNEHHQLGQKSKSTPKHIGKTLIRQIILNTLVPFLYAYGTYKGDTSMAETARNLLKACKPERNYVIRQWQELGISAKNSWETQALLQLKNEYCVKKRCLDCRIGIHLLKNAHQPDGYS